MYTYSIKLVFWRAWAKAGCISTSMLFFCSMASFRFFSFCSTTPAKSSPGIEFACQSEISTVAYHIADPVTRELRTVFQVREVTRSCIVLVNCFPHPFDGEGLYERHGKRLDIVTMDVLLLARIELLQEVLAEASTHLDSLTIVTCLAFGR